MSKRKITFLISSIVAVVIAVTVLVLFMKNGKSISIDAKGFDVEYIKKYLLSFGNWSVAALLLIFAVKPFLVVTPISVPAIVSGLLYGPALGSVYTMIGCFFSATVGFFIAKYLGDSFVSKLIKRKKTSIEGDLEKHGFKVILFLRLAMIFPYDPLSYAAGFSKMKYKHFILGTLIGVAPEMMAYNFIGTSIEDLFSEKTVLTIVVILILVLATLYFRAKKMKSSNEEINE